MTASPVLYGTVGHRTFAMPAGTAELLADGALDHLAARDAVDGCCPYCCSLCQALVDLLQHQLLDDLARPLSDPGPPPDDFDPPVWWHTGHSQVHRGWLEHAWRAGDVCGCDDDD